MDKRLWAEARKYRILLFATISLATIAGGIVVLQAGLLARLIAMAFLQRAALETLGSWLLVLMIVILVRALLTSISTQTAGTLAIRIKQALRERIMAHLATLGPAYTAGERSGELSNTATEGIEALDAYFREYLPSIFTAFLVPFAFLAVVLPIDGLTFVIMILTAPLIPIFMVLIGMAAGALARNQYSEMSFLSAHFLDVMQGLPTLKLFNRSLYQVETIGLMTTRFREATMKVLRVAFLSAFTLELLATLSVAVVAVEIGLRLLNGSLQFEPALFLLIIAPEYYQPLRTLGARFHSETEAKSAAERLFAILDTPSPKTDGTLPVPADLTLHFENVYFAYGEHPVLNGITLEIHQGQHIAIVGSSGSGKSTLANLLLRFVQPTTGRITVGGIDLQRIEGRHWLRQLAWVGQKPHLFTASIMANIQMDNTSASADDIMTAAKKAQAHDFVMALHQGYHTLCAEHGANLSGGQVQRIGLARAFLRDAPIFLLDEATAQLDSKTEAAIMNTLDQLRDKTLILIAHRLKTIQRADWIVVLENGQIVEQGTHEVLMAKRGRYHQMVEQDEDIA